MIITRGYGTVVSLSLPVGVTVAQDGILDLDVTAEDILDIETESEPTLVEDVSITVDDGVVDVTVRNVVDVSVEKD